MKLKLLLPILSIFTVTTFCTIDASGQATVSKTKAKKFSVTAKAETLAGVFKSADESFAKGDTKASAASIRSGAELLEKQIAVGEEKYTAPLLREVGDLKKLADGVEKGSIKKQSTLDSAFASAHISLAAFYNSRADRALKSGNNKEAGGAMNASANHIEKGASFSGQNLSDAGTMTVDLLRKTGGTLISGAGTGVDVAGSVLKGGLGLITKVGATIKGEKELSDKNVVDKTAAATGGVVKKTGETAELAGDAVKKTGDVIKKAGDAIKGEAKAEAPKE